MHDEVIVERDLGALIHETILVGNAATIRDVATFNVKPLGRVVAGMESHSDADHSGMPCHLRFGTVEQSGRDTVSAAARHDIQVLDLRNIQISNPGVSRSPVNCDVAGEVAVDGSDKTRPASLRLLAQISP